MSPPPSQALPPRIRWSLHLPAHCNLELRATALVPISTPHRPRPWRAVTCTSQFVARMASRILIRAMPAVSPTKPTKARPLSECKQPVVCRCRPSELCRRHDTSRVLTPGTRCKQAGALRLCVEQWLRHKFGVLTRLLGRHAPRVPAVSGGVDVCHFHGTRMCCCMRTTATLYMRILTWPCNEPHAEQRTSFHRRVAQCVKRIPPRGNGCAIRVCQGMWAKGAAQHIDCAGLTTSVRDDRCLA